MPNRPCSEPRIDTASSGFRWKPSTENNDLGLALPDPIRCMIFAGAKFDEFATCLAKERRQTTGHYLAVLDDNHAFRRPRSWVFYGAFNALVQQQNL